MKTSLREQKLSWPTNDSTSERQHEPARHAFSVHFRQNFLKLDVYFPVLKFESLTQRKAYLLENFFSKFGLCIDLTFFPCFWLTDVHIFQA